MHTSPVSEECTRTTNSLMATQSNNVLEQSIPLSPMSFCASPAPGPVLSASISASGGYQPLIPCTPISPSSSSPSSTSISTTFQYSHSPSSKETTGGTDCFEFLEYSADNSGQQRNPALLASQGTPGTPKPVMGEPPSYTLTISEHSKIPEKVQSTAGQNDATAWKEAVVVEQPRYAFALSSEQGYLFLCTPDRSTLSSSELRRQIHIQSEQKRRAQIKDGFEDLRNELPSCLNKKMSKVALLHRSMLLLTFSCILFPCLPILLLAVQHIQHLKHTQATILAELERLVNENEQLRK